MSIKSLLLSLSILFLFISCDTETILPEKLNNISTLGVISIHGNSIQSIERGLTVFGNEKRTNDISSWNIDEFITNETVRILKNRKYKVVPIKLTEKQLIDYYEKDSKYKQSLLKSLTKKHNIDLLFSIVKGNYVPKAYDTTRGISVIKVKKLGVENTSIKLNIYLEGSKLVDKKREQLHFNHIRLRKPLDNKLWADTTKPIDSKNLKVIEKDVKKLLKSILEYKLEEIGY